MYQVKFEEGQSVAKVFMRFNFDEELIGTWDSRMKVRDAFRKGHLMNLSNLRYHLSNCVPCFDEGAVRKEVYFYASSGGREVFLDSNTTFFSLDFNVERIEKKRDTEETFYSECLSSDLDYIHGYLDEVFKDLVKALCVPLPAIEIKG